MRLDGVSDVPQVADMVIDTNVTANRSEDPVSVLVATRCNSIALNLGKKTLTPLVE